MSLSLTLLGAAAGCSESESGGADADGSVDLDAGTADARPDLDLFDMFLPPPDAELEPNACLSENGVLVPTHESEPMDGLTDIQGDHDLDGDGLADILLTYDAASPPKLSGVLGTQLTELFSVEAAPGHTLRVISPVIPDPGPLHRPVSAGGREALFLLEQPGADQEGAQPALRVVDTAGADLGRVSLPGTPIAVMPVETGAGWRAAVNFSDGGCGIFDPVAGTEQLALGVCTIHPAWDANGDGGVDFVYTGGLGVALLDGGNLEDIARQALTGRITAGFVPINDTAEGVDPGPQAVRGMGDELVTASIEGNQLTVRYHREDLVEAGAASPLIGEFLRAEFYRAGDALRLAVEEERGGLRYILLYEAGTMRRRGEFGPYRTLTWSTDSDVDGDGERELRLLVGPNEDGIDGAQEFRAISDGDLVLEVESERNAAFELVLDRRGPLGTLGQLDGCEGDEQLLLRTGNRAANGNLPSRVRILDEEGTRVFQGEPLSGEVHRLALSDLEGDGRLEMLEVLSDGPGVARWRVYAWPPFRP
ncbi:MAG: hypothetical protein ACE366_01415 [Bradymonadia bacterium]